MVIQLPSNEISFPDPRAIPAAQREPDGFFAIGGDLSPQRLVLAYSYGIFPWTSFRDLRTSDDEEITTWNQIRWYCPMERFVIRPAEVHISHSMRSLLRKNIYRVSINENFDGVIAGCSEQRIDEEGAWLGPQMIAAYTKLHQLGAAVSVEVWQGEQLVGGLYGVWIDRVFIGESMFSRVPSASKLALIGLCNYMLQTDSGDLIDCQLETPHLRSMGGRYMSYDEYLSILNPGAAAVDVASK